MKTKINLNSEIELIDLSITPQDNGNYIVGNLVDRNFIALPEIAIHIIIKLQNKHILKLVKEEILSEFEFDIDIVNFVQQLEKYSFIKKIDSQLIREEPIYAIENSKLERLSVKASSFFFHSTSIISYNLIFLANIILIITFPTIFPTIYDIFQFPMLSISLFFFYLIMSFSTVLHELAHFLAAKKHGIHSSFGLQRRFLFLTAITDLTNLWTLDRKKRYIPFLAGMMINSCLLFFSLSLLTAEHLSWFSIHSFGISLLKINAIGQVMSLGFQLLLFVRSDLYYVLTNFLRCSNLNEDTKKYLRTMIKTRRLNCNVPTISEEDLPIVRHYSIYYLSGFLIIFLFIYFLLIPFLTNAIYYIVFKLSFTNFSFVNFIDATLLFLLIFVPWLIYFFRLGRSLLFKVKSGWKKVKSETRSEKNETA